MWWMFYYKISFSKKAVFLGKTAKNLFVGGHDRFEKGASGNKNQYDLFFGGIDVLNIFHLIIFLKKTIFSKITAKNYFWKHDYFWENGTSDDKNEYNFSFGEMRYQIQFLSFVHKTPQTIWLKHGKNWFWGHIFPHIGGSIGPIVSKTIGFIHEWTHTPHEFHENRFKTATCTITSYTYKYINITDL